MKSSEFFRVPELPNTHELFDASGTFTVPAGVTVVWVTVVGGGMGGTSSSGVAGVEGGSSSFGAYLTAIGGSYATKSPLNANNGGSDASSPSAVVGGLAAGGQLFLDVPIPVTPAEAVTVTIGAGGAGGAGSPDGTDGADGQVIVKWRA